MWVSYHHRYDNLDAVQAVVDTYEDGSAAHSNLPQNEEGDEDDEEVHKRIYIHTYLRTYLHLPELRERMCWVYRIKAFSSEEWIESLIPAFFGLDKLNWLRCSPDVAAGGL